MKTERASISARIIADSVFEDRRLTTMELTFPRFILAEFNTHRVLSRNSASSRAIPVWKRLYEVINNPFVPLDFGKNKAGMQSAEEVSEEDKVAAMQDWLIGRDVAVLQAYQLAGGEKQVLKDSKDDPKAHNVITWIRETERDYPRVRDKLIPLSVGVHKQHANRVLEPYAWHTVIATGTFWRNFYALRASLMAQPEINKLAIAMIRAHMASVPRNLSKGDWHLPYIRDEDYEELPDLHLLARVSSARSGRVSYLTHDGIRSIEADLSMADKLQAPGHMSPFEHPAEATTVTSSHHNGGNFGPGWIQLRKMLEKEWDFSEIASRESMLAGMENDERLVDFVLSLAA